MDLSTIFIEPESEDDSLDILNKVVYETVQKNTNPLSDFIGL